MKCNAPKIASFFLLIFLAISCSSDDEIIIETDPDSTGEVTNLIELDFSDPPIDLPGVEAQFAMDVPYDEYNKTTFDIFLPNSPVPTALVIFIHGGGFTGGDKGFIYTSSFPEEVVELLTNNIAVATINYRLLEENDNEGVIKSLNDSKRAVQYIRYIHNELNIDKDRIVLFGSSAGASTALWIATNDDLKQEDNTDPVLRESTRVKGIALRATQSSLDIENRWINDVFVDFGTTWEDLTNNYGEASIYSFYGVNSLEEYESEEIDAYRRSVDALSLMSSDDPEIWIENKGPSNGAPQTRGSFNHHPFHAREIKEFADAVGVPNVVSYGNPVLFSDPSNEGYIEFLMRKLDN